MEHYSVIKTQENIFCYKNIFAENLQYRGISLCNYPILCCNKFPIKNKSYYVSSAEWLN